MSKELILLIRNESVKNFGDILNYYAIKTPDKLFLIDIESEKRFTYFEFNMLVNKTSDFLAKQGMLQGDTLSIVLENSWPYLCFYFACMKMGIIVNPFPISLEPQDLIRYINYVEPKLIATNTSMSKKLSEFKHPYKVLEVEENSWTNFIENYNEFNSFPECNLDAQACCYYSSGTTANPKGIMISNRNMLTNIRSIVEGFRFNSQENHLIFLPLGHTASINYSMLPCLFSGGTITLAKSIWEIRSDFWTIIAKYRITFLEMVPTSLIIILNMKKLDKELDISSLKWIGCGSAQLLVSQQIAFKEKFGIPVGNLYGLSETGPSHIDYPLEDNWESGSIGFPLSVNECRVLDKNNVECVVGEIGEIVLKGENIFIGYFKNKKGYVDAVKDGYFYTGDLGYIGTDNKFYFSGRKKDLIIKGGVNILPAEIEEVLSEHINVEDVAVIGIPDRIVGEEVCAVVKLKDWIDEESLLNFCINKLSDYKLPKKIIIVDELPKGTSGKILKRVLKDKYVEKVEKNEQMG